MIDTSWNPVNPKIAQRIFERCAMIDDIADLIGLKERRLEHEGWLKLRGTAIGASEVSAILGQSSYASPFTIWGQKLGTIDPPEQTEAMAWGARLEALILEAYAEETGRSVQRTRWTYRNEERPHLIASPDGFQLSEDRDDRGLVQAKNTMIGWDEEIPQQTWIQMQSEMAVTGLTWNTAVALCGGHRLVWQDIERDQGFIDETLTRLDDFWHYVMDAEPLPTSFIDGSEHTKKALFTIFPENGTLEAVTLDGADSELHDELQGLKSVKKNATNRIGEIENLFRAMIGKATYGVLPDGGVYSLKTQSRKEHIVKESRFRVLRFKESQK